MTRALEQAGYEVVEASDSASALASAAAHEPALVLLDCNLADGEAFELQRELAELSEGLPVVAITGWAQVNDERLMTGGFLDVLVKPVDNTHLLEVVRRHLSVRAPVEVSEGRQVLLADDDPVQRRLVELALRDAGFQVSLADNGEEALGKARAFPPDVIVSDVLMPRMDGFAFCRAARSDPQLARVPIVLMSAHYLEAMDRELGTRFGATRYVSRSFGLGAVVAAVVEVAGSEAKHTYPLPLLASDSDYLTRIARQLERQARIGINLARRVSVQASALSVLDTLADSLAHEQDPESALGETLAQCLDGAGLSVGAILLRNVSGNLTLKAQAGSRIEVAWTDHVELIESSLNHEGLNLPGPETGESGEALLAALCAKTALIVPIAARNESLGVLLLASSGMDLAGHEGETAVRAARSVSRQLGQALALNRTFSQLSSSKQRYRALFENAHDAIAILTLDGRVLEANKGWEKLLGIPVAELQGRRIADFAPDERSADYELPTSQAASVQALPFRHADGGIVHVELSRTAIEVGTESFIFSIGRDVSDRVRLEEQLRQSQKMEAVGRLAGGIAHDYNNVLSVILSYSELLLSDLPKNTELFADIEQIHKAGKRAAALTHQLLTFSRQQVIAPSVLDLNEILADLDSMLRRLLSAEVELVALPAPGLGRIRADPGSIEQVIMNLVVNARDSMPDGGKLIIETANVFLDKDYVAAHLGVTPGPYVMLVVTDSGQGMDRQTQERIFEPFFTTKPMGKGTGLGLSTVFGIVQQSGGSIWVYSEPGRGTTFKVYLPEVDGVLDPRPREIPLSCAGGTETVLLVEDDDQVRLVALGILRRSGYNVLEAGNAGQALLHAESHVGVIHLLLTDVVMPQVSGPELARRLAITRPDMRVLFMSGYTDDSVVRHGLLESGLEYVQKPLTPHLLLGRLRQVLDEQ